MGPGSLPSAPLVFSRNVVTFDVMISLLTGERHLGCSPWQGSCSSSYTAAEPPSFFPEEHVDTTPHLDVPRDFELSHAAARTPSHLPVFPCRLCHVLTVGDIRRCGRSSKKKLSIADTLQRFQVYIWLQQARKMPVVGPNLGSSSRA